jgi:ubiquinone/menaquinone biosynthesis C-methylase UbiE
MTSKISSLVLAGVIVLAGCSVRKASQGPGQAAEADSQSSARACFDSTAEDYEANTHPITMRYAEAMLARLDVGPGVRFLDIAAGTGAASLPAAELGAEVVAIDFSPGMVERLRARGVPNIDVQQMDGQALTFPDASFDVTVSVFGVMVFPD